MSGKTGRGYSMYDARKESSPPELPYAYSAIRAVAGVRAAARDKKWLKLGTIVMLGGVDEMMWNILALSHMPSGMIRKAATAIGRIPPRPAIPCDTDLPSPADRGLSVSRKLNFMTGVRAIRYEMVSRYFCPKVVLREP